MWLTPRKLLWMDVIYFLRIAQHVQKLVEQSDVHEEPNAIVLTPKIKNIYPTDILPVSVRVA